MRREDKKRSLRQIKLKVPHQGCDVSQAGRDLNGDCVVIRRGQVDLDIIGIVRRSHETR